MKANQIQQLYSTGTKTAFTAVANVIPATALGFQIALSGVTATSTVSGTGLVLSTFALPDIEWDSLCAVVQENLTTNTITVTPRWEASDDGTNWQPMRAYNAPAFVQVSAAGTGSLVTTTYRIAATGLNPAAAKIRIAFTVGVATGGAGDNIVVAYAWRKRFSLAM